MDELIKNKLMGIEERFQVKVLYAVESGSRAWGFPSKDSDYDVRFIYIHQPNWYLAIDPQGTGAKREVVELPVNELLDINGWEITKALRLFRKSNPSLLEWMRSDMIYHQKSSFADQLRALEQEVYNPASSLHHYLNMAKNNYRMCRQGEEINIKLYLYVIRSILACKWIEINQTPPPIRFHELLEVYIPDGQLKKTIEYLVERKMTRNELKKEPRFSILDDFIKIEVSHIEAFIKTFSVEVENATKKLDELFRDILREVYN